MNNDKTDNIDHQPQQQIVHDQDQFRQSPRRITNLWRVPGVTTLDPVAYFRIARVSLPVMVVSPRRFAVSGAFHPCFSDETWVKNTHVYGL